MQRLKAKIKGPQDSRIHENLDSMFMESDSQVRACKSQWVTEFGIPILWSSFMMELGLGKSLFFELPIFKI